MSTRREWMCVWAFLVLGAGCATAGSRPDEGQGPHAIWLDGQSGAALSASEVSARIAAANVILVGEKHADRDSMATHVAVLDAVKAVRARTAVAIEWLPFSARLAVAGWIASDEPIESLGQAVDWPRVWGHDLAAYGPVLLAVRNLGFALVPVNAEPGVARAVARHGLEGVPDDLERPPPPLRGNAAHRAWFEGVMTAMAGAHAHGHGDDFMDRLYQAQLVWDETMALRAGELARAYDKVVVFAGTGHVGFGFGIPERLPETLTKLVVLPAASVDEARLRAVEAPLASRRGPACG